MTAIVTAAQVHDLAGVTVTETTVTQAQLMVSTVSGVQLDDADVFAGLRLADQRRLINAVVWQSVYLGPNPQAFTGGGSIVSASANGASVTYRADDGDADGLSGLAARELGQLSWRQSPVKARTLRPYARAARRGPAPDPWTTLA